MGWYTELKRYWSWTTCELSVIPAICLSAVVQSSIWWAGYHYCALPVGRYPTKWVEIAKAVRSLYEPTIVERVNHLFTGQQAEKTHCRIVVSKMENFQLCNEITILRDCGCHPAAGRIWIRSVAMMSGIPWTNASRIKKINHVGGPSPDSLRQQIRRNVLTKQNTDLNLFGNKNADIIIV